jgi:hypothetical protein
MDVQGSAYMIEALDAILTGPLETTEAPTVHLAAAAFAPGPSLTPASFTEATFTGYNPIAVVAWDTSHYNGTIALANNSTALSWTPTGTTVANTIYGYWLQDHAGNVVQSGLFPTPQTLDGPTTTLAISIQVGVSQVPNSVIVLP